MNKPSKTKKTTTKSKSQNLSLVAEGRGSVGKKPIVVQSQFQTFVGPDNGVLTSAFDQKSKVYELNNPKYFLKNIFYLIDEAKKDLKNSPESVPGKITEIKNLLIKTERLISNSS